MTEKSKLQYLGMKKNIFRYSQSSSNTIDKHDSENNLFSHSKRLKNGEKDYLSGAAKNKNYETENKGWNRRADEDDDYKTHYSSKKSDILYGSTGKYSRDYFTLVNGSEIDRQSQKYQNENKKYNNKELAISNAVTRNAKNSTDNFRHNWNKEQPKRDINLDKSKTMVDFYKHKKNGIENYTGNAYDKYNRQKNNTNNSYMNNKKGGQNSIYGNPNDVGRFDRSIDNRTKIPSYENKRKDYNKTESKLQIKNKPSQYEQINIQQNIQRTKNNKTPFIKYNQEDQSLYSKNRYSQNQIYDKTKLQQQKQIQILKYDSRKQPSTTIQNTIYTRNDKSGINSKMPRTDNNTKGEYMRNNPKIKPHTTYDKNNPRQPHGQQLPKHHSVNKERIRKPGSSYDTELIIHEHLLDRPYNLVRLEISVEKKKVSREQSMKELEPRKHEKIVSLKKRTQSSDNAGKLLNNTKRLNDSVEKKKEKPERPKLSNYVRVNLTPEKSKEERPVRQPGTRKHEVLCSSKKKKRQSFDKDGNPLTNTIRVDDNQEKKKKQPDKQRMTNYSKYESSPDKNKKDSKPKMEPSPRKNEKVYNNINERVPSYEHNRRYISNNDGRNKALKDKNKDEKYNKNKIKYNQLLKTKANIDPLASSYSNINKNYINRTKTEAKANPYSSYTKPIENKDKNKKFEVYTKPKNIQEKTSFPRHTRQKTGIDNSHLHISNIDNSKPLNNNPFSQSKYQTQSGFYPSKRGSDNHNNLSKTNEGWYPNQKNKVTNTTTHYNKKNEDYNKKYNTYKLNFDKSNNKIEKSDKINISYNSPNKGDKHINNFSNNNYSSKHSGKDKNTNFNIQSKAKTYKQTQSELKYFSPNNKGLNASKDIYSNMDKYYHPNKDDKKKYIVRDERSPSESSPKKYNEKDKYPKDEPRYQGYVKKDQDNQYRIYNRTQTGFNNIDKSKHKYTSLNKEKFSSYLNPEPSKRTEGSKTTDTKSYKSLYQSTYKEITKKYDNNNTRNRNESYTSSYQKNKYKETLRFNPNLSNSKENNHSTNNKSYDNWKSNHLINQKLSITSPAKQYVKETNSYINKTNKTSYVKNDQVNNPDYGDYSKYSFSKGNNANTSLNSNKNNKLEKISYTTKKEEIYSYNYNSKSINDKHKFNTILEEEFEEGYKNKIKNEKIKNYKYNSYGQANLEQDYDPKNYKYKFLTTKEICQQFWKSIEIGELPISMFDPNRNTGSRLANFFSPDKNYQNEKFTKSFLSNEDNRVTGSKSVKNMNETKQYNRSGYY